MATVNRETTLGYNPPLPQLLGEIGIGYEEDYYFPPTGSFPSNPSYLNIKNMPGDWESESYIRPMAVNREVILTVLNISLWIGQVSREYAQASPLRVKIEQAVLNEFAAIPEVIRIYVEQYRSEYIFKIFTSPDHYDDELMNKLLDNELDILDRFPSQLLTFHYLPHPHNISLIDIVSEEGNLIFSS